MLDAARIDDFGAEARQQELPDQVLVGVRDRQEGEIDFVAQL